MQPCLVPRESTLPLPLTFTPTTSSVALLLPKLLLVILIIRQIGILRKNLNLI
jgi:hypothetical protein